MKRAPLRSPPAVKKQSVSYSVVEEDDDEEVAAAGAPSLYLPADATAGSNYGVEDDGSESGEGSENEGSASASESRSRSASENEGHDRAVRVVPGVAVARDWISEVEVDSSKLLSFGRSDKWTHLADVHGDFQDTARNVGRIIISEMHLPDECKTIKPTSLGGVAGGKKFIHSGILFKFAEDAKLGDGTYLYGGIAPDLSKANKACGHEIKSCNAFTLASMELGVSHLLRCPLMAKISYRGSVIVALSLLPISGGSLVLGSNNGKTCTRSDEEANSLTSQVCNFLGLQVVVLLFTRIHGVVCFMSNFCFLGAFCSRRRGSRLWRFGSASRLGRRSVRARFRPSLSTRRAAGNSQSREGDFLRLVAAGICARLGGEKEQACFGRF